MRFYVVSVGDTTSPAFLTLGQQQQQTSNCEVRNQEGRCKEGSGVTHPGAVSQIPDRAGFRCRPNIAYRSVQPRPAGHTFRLYSTCGLGPTCSSARFGR